MKTLLRFGLGVLAAFNVAASQEPFSFSGYVETIPSALRVRDKVAQFSRADQDQFVNVTRARLRPLLSIWSDAQLAAEYEVSCLFHTSPLLFGIQTEENRRQVAKLSWNPVDERRVTVSHFVDRLHFRQVLGDWDIVIGRQRIAWGSGRVWNPTDLFNPINPTSFAKIEKDGVDAALVKYHLGSFTDISAVVNPQQGWNSTNSGIRLRTNYGEFDLSILGGRFDERTILGADIAGNLLGAGVRFEGIASLNESGGASKYDKWIVGVDYQFTPKIYTAAEYHFNGEGAAEKNRYDLLRLASGKILNVGRNYVSIQASILVHPLVNLIVSYTRNLDDDSQYIATTASYSVLDDLSIAVGGQLFAGDERSEFWWYPSALYFKVDLFF